MANTKYSDFFPYVLTELVGVSTLQAEAQIRGAVIDLCRKAKVWTHVDDPTATMAGSREYDVNVPSGTALVEIKALYLDGAPLEASSDEYESSLDIGTPRTYRQLSSEGVLLWPRPDREYLITMDFTLTPSRTSTTFPSWIAERYHDAIVYGTKYRLMGMPGAPWSNIQQAIYYRSLFDGEVAAARADAARSFVRAPSRTVSQH